jgi:hypothetical protein
MRQDTNLTKMYVSDYDSQMMPTYEIPVYENGSSQVAEPEIIIPISPLPNTPPKKNTLILENIENDLPQGNSTSVVSGTKDSEDTKPKGEPSATTDQTKTYVGGGTTPDSQIVVKKPTTKYFVYGIVGIVVAYLGYKVFFNKKSV